MRERPDKDDDTEESKSKGRNEDKAGSEQAEI